MIHTEWEDVGNHTFNYSFSPGAGKSAYQLSMPINMIKTKKADELVARVINFHDIPCFVESDLASSLQKFMDLELLNLKHAQAQEAIEIIRKDPSMIQTIATAVAEKYEKTWSSFQKQTTSSSKEFCASYHYLIHSPAMDVLLKLERKYHQAMAKFVSSREQSLAKMHDRHQMEMTRACEHVGFAYTAEDVTILASKHLADTERLQGEWGAETEQLTKSQKKELFELVVGLHKEMLRNNNEINEQGPIFLCVKQVLECSKDLSALRTQNLSYSTEVDSVPLSKDEHSPPGAVSSANGSSAILMEESFTVNLGAQLKTMHNIRLLVTDILNVCRFADGDEMEAQQFQTALSLYSNSLSAVVLLCDTRIGVSAGTKKDFCSICNATTEFHFPSYEEQIAEVRQHIREANKSRKRQSGSSSDDSCSETDRHDVDSDRLMEGDFYVTKHSNLSQVHVLFHLAADESQLQTKGSLVNVTSRHPVIMGLRHILKVASSHDIRTLTIPLLLTNELTEEITFQWCVKRAELVMKCMKGFMMEMATWDGGISRNIQFVIPPGVSEEAFDRLRSTLPEVFRTTSTRNLTPAHRRPAAR